MHVIQLGKEYANKKAIFIDENNHKQTEITVSEKGEIRMIHEDELNKLMEIHKNKKPAGIVINDNKKPIHM